MKNIPQIFYGLHMVEGVAEYKEPNKAYRVLVLENTIKQMDRSFVGRPLFVDHVPNVDYSRVQSDADGYVVDSFYNKADGKHWAKFIVVTDKGKDAIEKGFVLSNAYVVKGKGGGGKWHGVDYEYEVVDGEYDHLALVQIPRYQESVIYTPEQFKAYNQNKETELLKLANSKEKEPSMFNMFSKQKSEVSVDGLTVKLAKSGKEVSVAALINAADEAELANTEDEKKKENTEEKKDDADKSAVAAEKKNEAPAANPASIQMANGDHKVKVGESEMTVNELVAKHLELITPKEPVAAAPADDKQNEETEKPVEKVEDKKANALHFQGLKNAEQMFQNADAPTIELPVHQVARGKTRYGSK